jgi:hypothetical protein
VPESGDGGGNGDGVYATDNRAPKTEGRGLSFLPGVDGWMEERRSLGLQLQRLEKEEGGEFKAENR